MSRPPSGASTPTSWSATRRSRNARSARPSACPTGRPVSPWRTPRRGGSSRRVAEPRRVGRRGPAGIAYVAVGDHWEWFTSVIAGRKVREGDPIVKVIDETTTSAAAAAAEHPGDEELVALRDWLTTFAEFVRLFDRAVGLIPKLEPRELERGMRLLGEISDDTVLRLVHLLGGLPDDDVIELVEALSRLSPTAARRATKLMSGVVRTVAR